jgi:UDP-glucose 4-epimerase
MKTILITGGTGFIGEKLIESFLAAGFKVISLERSVGNKNFNNINFERIIFDLNDDINNLIVSDKVDILCHAAAYIPKNMADPNEAAKCFSVNALGTLKLLQFAEKIGIKHFIYFNSGNVFKYGNSPRKESDTMYPANRATFYLSSKLMGELYVKHFENLGLIKTTIFRVSSVYGNLTKGDLVISFIKKVVEGQSINISNPHYKTDFVYIDDITYAVTLAVLQNLIGVYNIGSGECQSLIELVSNIEDVTSIKANIVLNSNSVIKDRGFAALDNKKLKLAISTFSTTPIKVGIKKIIKELF